MDSFAEKTFPHLLADWGYPAVVLAVIADSFGIPIPGEVMLVLAATYAGATHHLALPLVIASAAGGAILGDNVSYTLARRGGYPLLRRFGRLLHVEQPRLKIGQYLFGRYGGHVVWLGRLLPVLHVWTAVLAGVNRMGWGRFALANAAGAIVWATGLGLAGYAFGRTAARLGGFIGAAAAPIGFLIAAVILLVLRANERRLYAEAEKMLGPQDDPIP